MRLALFCLPFLLAADLAAQSSPACGEAALAATSEEWDTTSVVSADLTLDGNPDVAYWKRDGSIVLLYIAACEDDTAVRTWRFGITLGCGERIDGTLVHVITPLLDSGLVDRVCTSGESDECIHMREENRRRQAVADAGGRELRIGGPPGVRLRWSREKSGFMRIGG